MSGSYIFSRVYSALAQREGKRVTLPTLVSMTGLTAEQIQGTIANARRTRPLHAQQIEVVKAGREWRLRSGVKDKSETAEEIVEAVEVGATHIWKRVLTALVNNAGKITSKELLAELASTPDSEITPHQAANAMDTIMRRPEIGKYIEVKWARNAWKYVDNSGDSTTPKTSNASDFKVGAGSVSSPIRGSVLRYFTQKPGVTVFLNDIADDLGFNKKQVQSAMWYLLNDNPVTREQFVVVQPSYAWQYVPNRAVVTSAPITSPASSNGHVTPELVTAPVQAYTPAAATTTLPVSSKVPNIPSAAEASSDAQTSGVVTSSRLFEEIDQLADGALLLREAESNTIYRATKLG